MPTILQFLIGALTCLPFILVVRWAGLKFERLNYAVGLMVAALIYVLFAIVGGASFSWLLLESVGLLLFSLVALLGLKVSIWALILGWAAHSVWDVLLHKVMKSGYVPEWYPIGCLGFDLVLAGYIIKRVKGRASSEAEAT